MFGRNKQKLRLKYDELLLEDIMQATDIWNHAKQTQAAVYELDDELLAQTKLAQAKYQFLYKEARIRRVKGKIQKSVIDY
ncbi:YaaL family protein [Ligilactobacillus sp. Marseille-Q7487]|uniref:YaaL family protein n=1 Tax=Ligilactobacillus sp. Marseille-Q7487 TaxID=3022128 RepID=UPI0015B40BBB|nr:YaaL family protein [Ligilactobacillus sp. Marseille-Q7487]